MPGRICLHALKPSSRLWLCNARADLPACLSTPPSRSVLLSATLAAALAAYNPIPIHSTALPSPAPLPYPAQMSYLQVSSMVRSIAAPWPAFVMGLLSAAKSASNSITTGAFD